MSRMRGFRAGVVVAAVLVVLGLVWMHQPAPGGPGAGSDHHHVCPDGGCLPHAVHFGAACLALAVAVVAAVRPPRAPNRRPVGIDVDRLPEALLSSCGADPPPRGGRAVLSRHCILRC